MFGWLVLAKLADQSTIRPVLRSHLGERVNFGLKEGCCLSEAQPTTSTIPITTSANQCLESQNIDHFRQPNSYSRWLQTGVFYFHICSTQFRV